MILAGTPTANTLSGIDFVTTAPAPMRTFLPIVQLGSIVAFAPIRVPFPIFTPPQIVAPGAT